MSDPTPEYAGAIKQGQTWRIRVAKQHANATAYDLTGSALRATLRKSYKALVAAATITCTVEDAVNGLALLELTGTTTAALPVGDYVFDVFEDTASGDVVPLVSFATLTVQPSATRVGG